MPSLKVVALISGGKDSFFSILHCQANGHEVVALANLYPAACGDAVEDIDSYMYQTVGHAIIPLYEQALGLPLYRQEILGSAVNQRRSYGPEAVASNAGNDETESLVPLLQKVKAAHPEVNAVSTGAILSDYQRTRVESIAVRLGLNPLSYLWQWPSLPPNHHSALLNDMAAVGQDSRIIKVASGGLDESFLWQDVAESRTIARLTKAAKRFGSLYDGAVLGEGGEFETLAVDGPPPLWKGKIVVQDEEREVLQGEAGTASVRIRRAGVRAKSPDSQKSALPRVPQVLDEKFRTMSEDTLSEIDSSRSSQTRETADSRLISDPLPSIFAENADTLACLLGGRTGDGATPAAQMLTILDTLQNVLDDARPEVGLACVAYTTIILRDMAQFAAINPVYGRFFALPTPPARVTIACADVLPEGCDIMLGVTYARKTAADDELRRGLHVQSQSYWAPANIGPYSQAFLLPLSADAQRGDVAYIAGQIPLIPASMELAHSADGALSTFVYQAVLALQHMVRIGDAVNVQQWIAGIAFVATGLGDEKLLCAEVARQTWHDLHRVTAEAQGSDHEADDFDLWNVTHGSGYSALPVKNAGPRTRSSSHGAETPPLWIIEVDALPRGANVEWVGYGSTTTGGSLLGGIPHLHHLLDVFKHRIL
ncbi:hypothetical protein B0A50_07987 [Salinomyces thailandicus]|uniref:Diphthine--ammonia ligase n=1 Tax=Salinomyces thailandicus TaxID=706561 RepID=A0A4U0TKR6_9PEZI|nr:hypothetical protein B0A50_07987 [Salinomyces thailandica]